MGTRLTEYGKALFEARMRVCVCLRTRVCVEGNKHLGTIHQLSTCNQRFGGFIDDIFAIWTYSHDCLHQFFEHINTIHPTINLRTGYRF